jgi:hypothetical protein
MFRIIFPVYFVAIANLRCSLVVLQDHDTNNSPSQFSIGGLYDTVWPEPTSERQDREAESVGTEYQGPCASEADQRVATVDTEQSDKVVDCLIHSLHGTRDRVIDGISIYFSRLGSRI